MTLKGFIAGRLLAIWALTGQAMGRPFNVAWMLRLWGHQLGPEVRFVGTEVSDDTVIERGAHIGVGVRIGPRVHVSQGVRVRAEVVLQNDVVLGQGSTVLSRCQLSRITVGRESVLCSELLCMGHGEGQISVGTHSYLGPRCVLDWSDNLTIGDFVHVSGPSTAFWTHSSVEQALHGDVLEDKRRRWTLPVKIEDHVYIGGNCTIYPGVTVGHHCIVLPNSAVNRDVPSGTMVGGVPAKVIRESEDVLRTNDV